MSLQTYYNEVCLNSSTWAHPNRTKCSCRGGWWLSELDTWHKCPYHKGPHPEEEEYESGPKGCCPEVQVEPSPYERALQKAKEAEDDDLPF